MRVFKAILPYVGLAVAAAGSHLLAAQLGKIYCLTQLTMAIYYAIVVMGLSLLMGFAGQVSLGQGAFFALGGYTAALCTTANLLPYQTTWWVEGLGKLHLLIPRQNAIGEQVLTLSPWAGFGTAMAVTGCAAVAIGYPALRLRGHYLAMATLGFGLIIYRLVLGSTLTGSADGIHEVPPWTLAGSWAICGKSSLRVQNYYIACLLALGALVWLQNLVRSRVGRALLAIHDRETAANAMGIDTASYKLRTFVISALLASMAGVFFTHFTGGIGPSESGALKSVRYVALAAAGGMANLWGVTLISIVINFLSLRDWFGSFDNAVFGGLLILIISLAPDGPFKPLGQHCKRFISRFKPHKKAGHGVA